MGVAEVARYLAHLAITAKVSASTQNQAFSALTFLYLDVLERPVEGLESVTRAKRPVRVPLVLARAEVQAILESVRGTPALMCALMHGAGLRLLECCRLRVFPADRHYVDSTTGQRRRHHIHESVVQREFAAARSGRARRQARDLSHAAPLLRHTSPREGLRHPHDPGAPGPLGRLDHDGLHARPQSGRPRRPKSPRRPGVREKWPRIAQNPSRTFIQLSSLGYFPVPSTPSPKLTLLQSVSCHAQPCDPLTCSFTLSIRLSRLQTKCWADRSTIESYGAAR
jgi:hypothetical protein